MSAVLQLSKRLTDQPQLLFATGISVRTFDCGDEGKWLDLRDLTFAKEKLGVRRWNAADFEAEFFHRWWWNPANMWLAEPQQSGNVSRLVGSVTLAMRGEPNTSDSGAARPVVHWLMVSPSVRRQGIGRALLSHLERAAWEAGHRQIWLETHSAWRAAAEFYAALGYVAS